MIMFWKLTCNCLGFCLNSDGKDQNKGVKDGGTGMSMEKCWMLCRQDKASKDCEQGRIIHWAKGGYSPGAPQDRGHHIG